MAASSRAGERSEHEPSHVLDAGPPLPARRSRHRGGGRPLPDVGQLHGLPQRPLLRPGRRRLHRVRVARLRHGPCRPRSLLAGGGPPRGHGSSEGTRRDRDRVLALSHADAPRGGAGHGGHAADLRQPRPEGPPGRDRAGAGWRELLGLPPDRGRQARPARELRRALRRRAERARAAQGHGPLRGRAARGGRHALGHRLRAGAGRSRRELRAVRHLPHPVHRGARARRQTGRPLSRAGPLPRVARERVPRRPELRGLPHARDRRGGAHRQPALRAARRGRPARLPGRQLPPARHARAAGRRGARLAAGPGARSHEGA